MLFCKLLTIFTERPNVYTQTFGQVSCRIERFGLNSAVKLIMFRSFQNWPLITGDDAELNGETEGMGRREMGVGGGVRRQDSVDWSSLSEALLMATKW